MSIFIHDRYTKLYNEKFHSFYSPCKCVGSLNAKSMNGWGVQYVLSCVSVTSRRDLDW
jgi:hypothetical protein